MSKNKLPSSTDAMFRVFDTLPGMYLVLSPDLHILAVSNIYCTEVAKDRKDIIDRYIFDVFPLRNEPEEQRVDYSLQQVMQTQKPHYLPVIRFDAEGKKARYWQTSNHPVFNEDGTLNYIIHQVEEVSERINAENKLTEGLNKQTVMAAKSLQLSKRLEKLLSEIPARMATLSGPDLVYEYVNSRYSKIFEGRDIIGKPILEALPELKDHPILQKLREVYETGITHEGYEVCIPLAQYAGGPLVDTYFNLVYQPRYDEIGQINGILSFAYDITELVNGRRFLEQKEKELLALNEQLHNANEEVQAINEELNAANEELSQSNNELLQTQNNLEDLNTTLDENVRSRTEELLIAQQESEKQRERLTRFFMQAPAGICVLDGPDYVYELVNPDYQKMFPGRILVGKTVFEALPELKDGFVKQLLDNVYNTGELYEANELLVPLARTKNGPIEDRYFNFIYQARHDLAGKVDGILVFVFEVTELVVNRMKDQVREQRFKFLLNAIPQQVWTAKPDGKLDYVNDIVVQDFGKDGQEIVGTGWQAFIHPDDLQDCLAQWTNSLRSGTEYSLEFRLLFADGTYKWHLARAIPLIEDGEITLWIGTNTNIEIQKYNEQRKDEFLSIASHELKTPLTSIKAFNQLMGRAKDAVTMQEHLKKSSDNIIRLEKLINDLLDVTKITAGKMQYNMEQFNFNDMLNDVVAGFRLTAQNHEFIVETLDEFSFYGDHFRLEQVLNNFLSNAVKYSPNGKKIVVKSWVENDNVIVAVRDFGIGIAKQDVNRLFERYYRVDNTSMRFEGLGLGLFIASEILKRHKGNFWLESKEGEGSTFFFRLPIGEKSIQVHEEKEGTYHDENVKISYNRDHNRLDVDWTGHQNFETVKNGCLKILQLILKFKVTKILNNNTNVVGSWSDASEWVGESFFPMMEKHGVHSLAWIYSPNVFSQLSAQKSIDVAVGNITTQFFTNIDEAETWINKR